MTRLVRLYPRPWRDRYETEFVDLMSERPQSASAVLDLVRGALDAHLHPQVDVTPMPWTHRLPGIAIVTTGILWSAAIALLLADGGYAGDELIGLAAMTVLLGLPGDYAMPYGRRILAAFGGLAAAVALIFLVPWEIAGAVAVAAMVVGLSGLLALAAIRAEIGATKRWLLVAVVVVLPIVLGFVAANTVTLGRSNEAVALLAVPYGLTWLLIGLRLIVRGSPTIIDPPLSEARSAFEMEIPA